MTDSSKDVSAPASPSASETYDAHYFEHSCGVPYRCNHSLGVFSRIADRIVDDIAPSSVLDAGCAMGFLVEALRDRGVEAAGFDVSQYALGKVRDDIRPFTWRASITEALPRDYDLIVCIEVLEHLSPEEAETAIDNLCAHTNEILFSSTPTDYSEPTHVNVRPTSHWVAHFGRRGFVPDVGYDASYITPWSRRFRRKSEPAWRVFETYERALSRLDDEVRTLREQLLRKQRLLEDLDAIRETRTFRFRNAFLNRYAEAKSATARVKRAIRR
jgi:SAM-dependent methyltransferase